MRPFAGRTARVRLALIYSGVFLALAIALILVILLATRSASTSVAVATPSGGPVPNLHITPRLIGAPVGSFLVAQHNRDIARLLVVCLIVLALTAAAAFPIGWFASGRMLRPLRQITARARTISAGNLHERLALPGGRDEFTELGETLDDLLGRLETSFDAQRRFVANASHELRTPLTVERTLLQVALADPNASAETLRATCEELLAAGHDQERLIEALLTLAGSERGLEVRQRTDIGALATPIAERPRPELDQHQIELETHLEAAITEGDPALIERLIANLVDNAVRHNIDGGRVEISTRQQGDRALLIVENTGQLIAPEEIETMFEPFRRLGPARTGTDQGQHGLGLSIVRAIADAHSAEIDAHPRPGGGLSMTVAFPAPGPASTANV
ncbi:MAG TPA: ATP-binding protein [Solirubrobacteraceae bacterium]|jgi:signal transduction histidine kinase|nr:ATP-binding protein [Solirubrobacteraceae bacterium]